MAPTSFASAAAGNTANSSSRPEAPGDWSRRANGATQTFRRPSHATTPSGSTAPSSASRDASAAPNTPSANSAVYVPPHRNGASVEGRYSRDQMLHLYRSQRTSDEAKEGLSNLFVGNWEPSIPNGSSSASWGRKDDGRENQSGVDLCWDKDGSIVPLSLSEMTDDEREVFTTSVNSPLKPPAQNSNKDGPPKEGLSLRKTSVSGAGAYGLSSPTSARPGNRRRDTGDASYFPSSSLASPSASRFARDESSPSLPPSLARRRTDFRDQGGAVDERDKEKGPAENANPFGSLKRTTAAPFATAASAFSPMGAFGNFAHPQAEKKPSMGSVRGESRFKGLMSKGSMEDVDKGLKEKSSIGSLRPVSEAEPADTQSWAEARFNRPTSNDTDPYPDDDAHTGSAALRGGDDRSPPRQQGLSSFGTPHRQDPRDGGIAAFGMTQDAGLFHPAHQTPHRAGGGSLDLNEPMSPTDTNPYQSPDHGAPHHDDGDMDRSEYQNNHFPGMGSFQIDPTVGAGLHGHAFGGLGPLGRTPGAFDHPASDRSQTSSVGPNRGFPTIPGLGGGIPGLGGSSVWPAGPQSIGTPVRDRVLGGGLENVFGNPGEAQSPSLAGLGSNSLFGAGAGGTIGRTSRLGSLFPPSMQEQMRSEQHRPTDDGSSQGDRQQSMTGTFGRAGFGSQAPGGAIPARDTDSPFRNTRNLFDDFSGGHMDEGLGQPTNLTTSLSMAALNQTRTAQPSVLAPGISSPASNQPPPPQQRTMVMPDRMRWIYRDPSGNVQGPFSGLEMHDWYKAGFFSPELLVKKQEDVDYEPLLQLIRKIGNSREPFLVPQIGIPHGPPTTVPGNTWAGTATANPSSGAQPPFANAFPSFGTTLTAEQQNALERRKQEEQFLMARQKEHLAQQQAIVKQTQMGITPHGMLPHQLQHHSSAHSLHSQPSFGSITSPGGYQPSPTQAALPGGPAVPGLLDNAFRPAPVPGLGPVGPGLDMLGNIREEDMPAMMERLNLGRPGPQTFGTAPPTFGQQQPDSNTHAQQVVAMLNDRVRLEREQKNHDSQCDEQSEQVAAQASSDRLQQFHDLRLQTDLNQSDSAVPPPEGVIGKPTASPAESTKQETAPTSATEQEPAEPLSLTEQVQKAASAKQTPATHSAWNKVEPAIHPFPPPPSQSPLPAPAAQRKPIAADSLAAEARSRSQTPSVDTPSASIAPWAKEPAEAPRGPSLREIQEAEAKKAAEREALAAAARREALEQELLAQAQAPSAQPGLPSSSTWASGASPITPGAGNSSVWAKPLTGKTQGQSSANAKKTLQQIQKEEEARKQRLASQAAATANAFSAAPQPTVTGKRYADLASKNAAPQPVGAGGAWTTVGSSGKVKGIAPPASPATVRSASSTIVPAAAKKPVVTRAAATGGQGATQANAQEEFKKWAVAELRGDLNKNIIVEDFVAMLLSFPPEMDIITESVHGSTHNIDSRHFAEEFLRRRKMAEKGQFDDLRSTASPAENKSGGGWSEVAKKSTPAAQQQQSALDSANGNFKIVQAKGKKGGRRG